VVTNVARCEGAGEETCLQKAAAVSIEVTLYLPWGVATGITVPNAYFGHYIASFFTRNDAEDVAGRIRALEAEQARVFLHLRKARCYVASTMVEHALAAHPPLRRIRVDSYRHQNPSAETPLLP
jgi:hypothetical protein